MLSNLKRIYRAMRHKAAMHAAETEQQPEKVPIPTVIAEACTQLKKQLGDSSDIVVKELLSNTLLLAYIDGMTDRQLIDSELIRPIFKYSAENKGIKIESLPFLEQYVVSVGETEMTDDLHDCADAMMRGETVLFLNGSASALRIILRQWKSRAVEEPKSESVIRGPREGFTENIQDNSVMIRRKIHDGNLVFESMRLGQKTKTKVSICYIKGVANEDIVAEARKRLRNIHTDAILESGYLEEYIDDAPFSIFPTVGVTERPDTVAGKILEGRVAILCDGTPFVLTVPNLFIEYLQSSEDYYTRWIYTPLLRLIRLLALFASVMTPAFYVMLVCFHQDVIPFKFLLTIAASSEGVPFPPAIECLLLIVIFEIIREGGVRMPKSLGQAISIVGALIIGQAAVQAGIVSAPAVIVIAASAITSFIIPKMDDAILIMRITTLFAANSIGFLGLVLSSFMFLIYVCSIKSFGIPYLSPIAPHCGQDMRDTFIRMPLWSIFGKSETITRKYAGDTNQGDR